MRLHHVVDGLQRGPGVLEFVALHSEFQGFDEHPEQVFGQVAHPFRVNFAHVADQVEVLLGQLGEAEELRREERHDHLEPDERGRGDIHLLGSAVPKIHHILLSDGREELEQRPDVLVLLLLLLVLERLALLQADLPHVLPFVDAEDLVNEVHDSGEVRGVQIPNERLDDLRGQLENQVDHPRALVLQVQQLEQRGLDAHKDFEQESQADASEPPGRPPQSLEYKLHLLHRHVGADVRLGPSSRHGAAEGVHALEQGIRDPLNVLLDDLLLHRPGGHFDRELDQAPVQIPSEDSRQRIEVLNIVGQEFRPGGVLHQRCPPQLALDQGRQQALAHLLLNFRLPHPLDENGAQQPHHHIHHLRGRGLVLCEGFPDASGHLLILREQVGGRPLGQALHHGLQNSRRGVHLLRLRVHG
mmetsp:Transcript_19612/g.41362  ORF Transcript_19612/g.41362 Transcript_19612/m.41362 type:complete len:414 (-) Transcript_19612:128-1369(-)